VTYRQPCVFSLKLDLGQAPSLDTTVVFFESLNTIRKKIQPALYNTCVLLGLKQSTRSTVDKERTSSKSKEDLHRQLPRKSLFITCSLAEDLVRK